MLTRFVVTGLVLAAAAATSQLPEFAQQYRQRLGGAVDELKGFVTRFDADAQGQGLSREQALDRHATNPDDLFRQRGISMQQTMARLDRLESQQARMQEDNTLLRVTTVATHGDRDLIRSTLSAYEPAVPLTTEGGIFAALGGYLGWLLIRLVTWPKRALDQRLAWRRYQRGR